MIKDIVKIMVAIGATGAVLNTFGSGVLGEYPKKLAEYITKGYGV